MFINSSTFSLVLVLITKWRCRYVSSIINNIHSYRHSIYVYRHKNLQRFIVCSYWTAYFRDRLMLCLYDYKTINGGVGMSKYSLDITSKDKPFINIEVEDDRVLLGAYEGGKIARRLFFINKEQLELLIDGLRAANILIHNEVDLSQFIIHK